RDVFINCRTLSSVQVIKTGRVNINSKCTFSNCCLLKEFEMPNFVTSIGDKAFEQCSSLSKIILGNRVECLKDLCFANCINLEEISLPKTVTYIGNYTFLNCVNLQRIYLPKSVSKLSPIAFLNCEKLHEIYIEGEQVYEIDFPISFGVFQKFLKNGVQCKNIYFVGCDFEKYSRIVIENNQKICEIPKGVNYLSKQCLHNYYGYDIIHFPQSLKKVENLSSEFGVMVYP
ncbi:leucine rich repeat containing protein BspA family protein, partial [Entamoeba invadens IP1]